MACRGSGVQIPSAPPQRNPAPVVGFLGVCACSTIDRIGARVPSKVPNNLTFADLSGSPSQSYAVETLCRMLYTLDTGQVTSKRASLEWAKQTLTSGWHHLIQPVLDDRAIGWDPEDAHRIGTVEATLVFAAHVKERFSAKSACPGGSCNDPVCGFYL
jgi:hypothetical protein